MLVGFSLIMNSCLCSQVTNCKGFSLFVSSILPRLDRFSNATFHVVDE